MSKVQVPYLTFMYRIKKNFQCVIERFRRTGSVKMEKPVKEKTVTTDENIEKMRKLVEGNIGMSLNQMSVETGLPKTTVWTILRKSLNFYPYRRLNYNKWLLGQPENFAEFVIWTVAHLS